MYISIFTHLVIHTYGAIVRCVPGIYIRPTGCPEAAEKGSRS